MKPLLFDRKTLDHFDFPIIFLILPIIGLSLFLVFEANQALAVKQLSYTLLGIALFFLFFLIPIRRLVWAIPIFYWLGILLLVLVEFFGTTKLGAQRWLEIPFVGLTIQPSEMFKPAFVLMLAYQIHRRPPPSTGYSWKQFFKLSFYIVLPFVLIAIEPDLGTATLLLAVGAGVLVAVGIRRKVWVIVGISAIFVAYFGYGMLHDYQKKRIHDFISEKPSYHVQQSMIAIGSGGMLGKTKEDATQTQLRFLPIATSDFIFSYYVERFGFLGAVFLIALYAMLVFHLFTLNSKVQGDYLSMVTITAVAIMIFVNMTINIAMTIGLAPVVGVPLPLFSHGGSSFINFMILFGIIQNLLAFRFNFLYTSALHSGL